MDSRRRLILRTGRNIMKQWLAALCALGTMSFSTAVPADAAPDSVSTALAAIENAKAVAKAGRGSLLMVGSILSSDDHPRDQVVVVLDYPIVRDMEPGMVLILAKVNCEPIDDCLIARRVTSIDAKHGVETEPYGGAEGLLLTQIKATLLGSVAYAVDMGTGAIRDLRPDVLHAHGAPATISVSDAVAREAARTRGATAAAPGPGT
jgi:hypothetical protein